MKNIFEHIEKIREKPHHIRKQIVFSSAVVGAVAIALIWIIGSVSTGAFAIRESSFADIGAQGAELQNTTGNSGSGTAGIAGAAAAISDPSAPAHIEIIDTSPPSASSSKQAEQTIIPF